MINRDSEKSPDYVEIVEALNCEEKTGEQILFERSHYLYALCVKGLEAHKVNNLLEEEKIGISTQAIDVLALNYFADIVRLKDFHDILRTNPVKVAAYGAYWFMRERPIYITGDAPPHEEEPKLSKLNAAIALFYINDTLFGDQRSDDGLKNYRIFIRSLLYTFRYRVFSPQNIELALEAILTPGIPFTEVKSTTNHFG